MVWKQSLLGGNANRYAVPFERQPSPGDCVSHLMFSKLDMPVMENQQINDAFICMSLLHRASSRTQ